MVSKVSAMLSGTSCMTLCRFQVMTECSALGVPHDSLLPGLWLVMTLRLHNNPVNLISWTGCRRYSLALYAVDTASNVQRAGPFTVVVGSGVFTPAAAPAPSASGASTAITAQISLCILLMWVVAASLC